MDNQTKTELRLGMVEVAIAALAREAGLKEHLLEVLGDLRRELKEELPESLGIPEEPIGLEKMLSPDSQETPV